MSEFTALDRKQVLLDKWDSVGKDLSHTINLAELIVEVWEVAAVTTEESIVELLEEQMASMKEVVRGTTSPAAITAAHIYQKAVERSIRRIKGEK